MKTDSSRRVSRNPKCARCRNHGYSVPLKGHAGRCQFSPCSCWKCALISERTRIAARQRGLRKGHRQRGAAGEAAVRVPESPARATGTEGQSEHTELEAPTSSGARAATTDPSDHCRGRENAAISEAQPHLPSEFIVREIPQNAVYSSDLAMALPFHLHPHYASAYVRPPFLLSFGAPPLGAIGFPHVPHPVPPLMEAGQEGQGIFYTPYFLHPRPDQYQQYVWLQADGTNMSHDPGVMESNQR